ncbi:hypothetical protein LIN78_00925 [Leeia sp. TBRC 13508]|uniref:Toxin CptA n=1 Tax=Leeia speluncae TaxID=2884804 RepID=A0ABS8D381_9NEIS|nr:hypothetical protein [Leeia speluncae]MCB6182118.1 hypothetical protein [Leeia speluncae]
MTSILLVVSATKFWFRMLVLQWFATIVVLTIVLYAQPLAVQGVGLLFALGLMFRQWQQYQQQNKALPKHLILHETHLVVGESDEQNTEWYVGKGSICWFWLVALKLDNDAGVHRQLLLHRSQFSAEDWSTLLRTLKMGWSQGVASAE